MSKFHTLDPIRDVVGKPKRKTKLFSGSPIDFPEPEWLKDVSVKDDPLKGLGWDLKKLWKRGEVVWGCVLKANNRLYCPGDDDCPGEILFAHGVPDHDVWFQLQTIKDKLWQLAEITDHSSLSQREKEWAEDMVNDFCFHQGFKIPEEWTEGDYRVSSVLFHRAHLPERHIKWRRFPCLALPDFPYSVYPVPAEFWPDDFEPEPLLPVEGFRFPVPGNNFGDFVDEKIGPVTSVFHETEIRKPHVDVYRIDAREGRDFSTLITSGMSLLDQPGINDRRTELVFYATEFRPEAVDMLRNFAHYPWESGAAIDFWNTIPLKHHAERILGSPRFENLLFVAGLRPEDQELGGSFRIEEKPVFPLMVVPITNPEFEFFSRNGPEEWNRMVAESEHSILFHKDRPCLITD